MILKKEKIIFIHIPKNAGQSIESFFGRKWAPAVRRCGGQSETWPEPFPRHAPWKRYEKKYDVKNYRAFAIIRNPWARMVSCYTYELKMAKKGINLEHPNRKLLAAGATFEEYVRKADHASVFLRPQVSWLRNDNGEIGVADIIRFENLTEDFKRLARDYNLDRDSLPHVNRSDHKHYSHYYNEETIRLVAEMYKEDIEMFGYTFERVADINDSEPAVLHAEPVKEYTRTSAKSPPVMQPGVTYRLPNFLILGGMKCGTSSISHNLNSHPQVHMARDGFEVHFFDRADNYNQGLDWYRAHFPQQDGVRAYGDKTPTYADVQNLPRIRQTLPDAKLIMILRDPVGRFQSQYNYTQRPNVKESIRLAHAREFEIEHLEEPEFDKRILLRGFYDDQLEELFRLYPREQVHVAFLDDFKADECDAYNRIMDFIGVERIPLKIERFNELDAYRFPFTDQAKKDLFRIYEPHNRRLFSLLGREQPAWMKYGQS
jgi:hypothetical protein